ncbi:hypothetical protein PT974_00253 [Cladobotryum mycophilum]|uniref:Uncharacterized protein n=1 Tax=Cladobotryum mycophilum TaxID=491253 RepID=A0ABR0T0E9_9HYPO
MASVISSSTDSSSRSKGTTFSDYYKNFKDILHPTDKTKPEATMSKRYFVETAPGGRQQFVSVKRTRSYGGHHHHVREIDYIKVSLDEWNGLVEKERKLQEVNKSVVDECNTLKSTLLATQADNKRLNTVVIPGLDKQIACLTADNEALRRSLDHVGDHSSKHHREEDKLRSKVVKLEKDNIELRNENLNLLERNKSLQKQTDGGSYGRRVAELIADVEYWKNLSRSWRSRYLGLRQRYDEIYDLLETRSKKLRAYEDILQRNNMI